MYGDMGMVGTRHRDINFKPKGYWPVNGNKQSLDRLGVKVDARPASAPP